MDTELIIWGKKYSHAGSLNPVKILLDICDRVATSHGLKCSRPEVATFNVFLM